jgi:hypothetical protein
MLKNNFYNSKNRAKFYFIGIEMEYFFFKFVLPYFNFKIK